MSISFDDGSGRLQKQGFSQREPAWDSNVKWWQFPDGDPNIYYYRLVARPTFYATHWIPTKKADGTEGKAYPVLCCDYDSKANSYVSEANKKCVICDFMNQVYSLAPIEKDKDGKNRKAVPERIKRMNARLTMAHNAIVREVQQQGAPQNNSGNWTFIYPIRLPQGAANLLAEKEERFGHRYQEKDENGNTFSRIGGFAHALYGKDIAITYNSGADAQKMYQIDVGPRDPVTPLTDEEKSHRNHLIDFASLMKYPSPDTLQKSLEKNGLNDYLMQLSSLSNLRTVAKTIQPATKQENKSDDSAFDVGNGLAVHSLGEIQGVGNINSSPAQNVEDDVPNFPSLETWQQQQASKASPAEAVKAPPITASTASASPVSVQAKPQAGDVTAKIEAFSQTSGVKLVVDHSSYEKVRLFKPGMSVPECFKTYLVTSKTTGQCKGCPLRMDCMMISPAQVSGSAVSQQSIQG